MEWGQFYSTRRQERGLCALGSYNLTGLPEPRCPECGREFDAQDEEARR